MKKLGHFLLVVFCVLLLCVGAFSSFCIRYVKRMPLFKGMKYLQGVLSDALAEEPPAEQKTRYPAKAKKDLSWLVPEEWMEKLQEAGVKRVVRIPKDETLTFLCERDDRTYAWFSPIYSESGRFLAWKQEETEMDMFAPP